MPSLVTDSWGCHADLLVAGVGLLDAPVRLLICFAGSYILVLQKSNKKSVNVKQLSRVSGGTSEGAPAAMPPRAGRKAAPEALTMPREHRPRASKTAAPTASEQLNPPELNTIHENAVSQAAPSMAVVHDVAEGSTVDVETVVEAAAGSIVPVEAAVKEAGASVVEEELSTPTTTPSDDRGEISSLQLLVTQLLQQNNQLLQQSNQQQQQINQLIAQRQADKQQQGAEIQLLKQQQTAEIQMLKHEVARLRDDVGKRSSHQDQAASLERANTQLAALGRDVEQLQRQQPKQAQRTGVETHTAIPGQQARRGSPGVADDAHGSIAHERAHNFLLHRFPEGAENEQCLMQLVEGVVHGDLGVKGVDILSTKRVNGQNPASPVLVQVGDAAQCIKVLRAASQLRHSTRYKGVGLTPDLTKQQREHKQKQWGTYLSLKKQGYTVCFHGDALVMWNNKQWMPIQPPTGPPPPPAGPPAQPPTQTSPVPQAQLPGPPSERVA